MLKFQILTPQDRKEAAAIERRRQYEEERKKRIFNARERLIGVDVEGLEKQICERKILQNQEKRTLDHFALQQVKDAQIALALEKQQIEEKKKIEKEVNEFRKLYQRKEDTREFDLNDPNFLKNSLPARLKDDDPRLGPSSVQKFQGEDFLNPLRIKEQRLQTKSFLEQQMQEKMAAENEYKKAEKQFQDAVIARDARAIELQKIEEECKKRLNEANMNFNLALMDQQEADKKRQQVEEEQANYAEMYNAITGDFLTENPLCAMSNMGPNRAQGYKYKGMTEEERMAIREIQRKQAEEMRIRKQDEKRLEKYWEDFTNSNNKYLYNMDKERRQKQQELLKQIAEENLKLAKEQKDRNEYMEKVVYRNKPTAAYYNWFNKSTR